MSMLTLRTPLEVLRDCAVRARGMRLEANITQSELASRTGISVGTVKRFERTGEIQFNHLLRIALVLGRLEDFDGVFRKSEVPSSLFDDEEVKPRKRARGK